MSNEHYTIAIYTHGGDMRADGYAGIESRRINDLSLATYYVSVLREVLTCFEGVDVKLSDRTGKSIKVDMEEDE